MKRSTCNLIKWIAQTLLIHVETGANAGALDGKIDPVPLEDKSCNTIFSFQTSICFQLLL